MELDDPMVKAHEENHKIQSGANNHNPFAKLSYKEKLILSSM
jgi:hypothetical protein